MKTVDTIEKSIEVKKKGGNPSRNKGNAGEREVKRLFESYGFETYRTGSGICPDMPSDVVFKHNDKLYICEVKFYKDSFKRDYNLLEKHQDIYGAIGRKDKDSIYCTTYMTVFIQSILEGNLLPVILLDQKETQFNKYQLYKLIDESNVAFANNGKQKKVHLLVKRCNRQPWLVTYKVDEVKTEVIRPKVKKK